MEARWAQPTQLNGVLQRYLLYVSVDNSSVGQLVYNNSDFFTDYIIPDLEAGTQYFIRAGVSSFKVVLLKYYILIYQCRRIIHLLVHFTLICINCMLYT